MRTSLSLLRYRPMYRSRSFSRMAARFSSKIARAARRSARSSACKDKAAATMHTIAAKRMATILRIGLISDTHGLVHPRVPELFANVDHIIHAGDVGGAHVLAALRALAPVTYVDGNNDD